MSCRDSKMATVICRGLAPRLHHGDVHDEMAFDGEISGEDISLGIIERVGSPFGRRAGARMKDGLLDGETISTARPQAKLNSMRPGVLTRRGAERALTCLNRRGGFIFI